MNKRLPLYLSFILLLLLVGIEFAAILRTNFGMFVYTLDDAYIHLSIAENIANGNYGINPGEFASAASSILWPFLLAPFTYFYFGLYAPFVLNVLFAAATLYIVWSIFEIVFAITEYKLAIISILLVLLIPAIGMVGLIFTGMEHSLQVFSVILILYAIIKELYGEFDVRLMMTSIIVASIVRYENLSVCIFAITFFFVRGKIKQALFSLIPITVLLLLFSFFLYANEGSLLPTSVLAKIGSIRSNVLPFSRLLEITKSSFGMLYGIVVLALIIIAYVHRKNFTMVALSSGAAFVTLLHLLYGKVQYFGDLFLEFGYYFRYEMYLWTFLLIILIVLSKNILILVFRFSKILFFVFFTIAEIVLCGRNNAMLLSIPTASNNIFEQQVQVHSFVTRFYQKPVAVNDIGYVSFNNNSYVLDLWGLASKKVLNLRKSNPGKSEWLDSLVTAKKISLVIIYDVWFTARPVQWEKIAEMTLTKPNITASENVVSFYAVNNKEEILQKIRAFRNEMPEKEMLRIIE